MDCNYIREKVAETIIECQVKCFPIDCFQLLQHYGYKIYSYSELEFQNHELYLICNAYSEDAFRIGSKHLVAYNDKKPKRRIRFSLMHELGHHILGHKSDSSENEEEANYFANNLLAPRIAMYYAKLKTVYNVSEVFDLSSSAAYYAAQDFSEWCNDVCKVGMHNYDKILYQHFYDEKFGGFVYSIKKCEFCGATVYNERLPYCTGGCDLPDEMPVRETSFSVLSDEDVQIMRRLEHNWLYNF